MLHAVPLAINSLNAWSSNFGGIKNGWNSGADRMLSDSSDIRLSVPFAVRFVIPGSDGILP
jgi:hypothetical protein